MDNKMKKSKYAALVLASTMALSTVVTAAPQAFDNNAITAHAAAGTEVNSAPKDITSGDTTKKVAVISISSKDYIVTVSTDTVAIKDTKDKEVAKGIKDDIVKINNTNYKISEFKAATDTDVASLTLTELKQVKPADVTKSIKALNISENTLAEGVVDKDSKYQKAIVAIEEDLALLTATEREKLKSSITLLAAYKALGNDVDLNKAIQDLPTKEGLDIEKFKTYSVTEGKPDTDKKTVKKGKVETEVTFGINKEFNTEVAKLNAFKALYAPLVAKENTNASSNKAVLAAVNKIYTDANKVAITNQKLIEAEFNVDPFEEVYKVLTTGGEYNIIEEEIKNSNGKFKVDGDNYVVASVDNKIQVTDPNGEDVEPEYDEQTKAYTFEVDNYDEQTEDDKPVKTGESTYTGKIQITINTEGKFVIGKVKETYKESAKVPELKLDSKTTTTDYKKLKAGTGKYNDAQLDLIQAASAVFKKLDSGAKKLVSKDDQKVLKQYETDFKTQQSLEKKMISEDAKGVAKQIKALSYGKTKDGEALYSKELVEKANSAYKALTPKFQKKVGASTVADLNAHLATYKLVLAIDELDTGILLTAKNVDGLKELKKEIEKLKTSYTDLSTGKTDKVGKKKQGFVKNYKKIAAVEKLIATQETYFTNKDNIEAWQEDLAKVTGKKDVQIIDNKVALAGIVYSISYDKTKKVTTLTPEEGNPIILTEVNNTVTDSTSVSGYQLVSTKGKLKIDKVVTTNEAPAIKLFVMPKKLEDFAKLKASEKYTAENIAAIEKARATNKALTKDAKKFVIAADDKELKSYETNVKAQQSFEKKQLSDALKSAQEKITKLTFGAEGYTEAVEAARTAYDDFTTTYKDDSVSITAIEKSKAKLENHEALVKVVAAIVAIPNSADVTEDSKTIVEAGKAALDALTNEQKKLIPAATQTNLKNAENVLKALEKLKVAKAEIKDGKYVLTGEGVTWSVDGKVVKTDAAAPVATTEEQTIKVIASVKEGTITKTKEFPLTIAKIAE